MPRFAANISLLFTDVPLRARPARARASGFAAVECLWPYEIPAEALAAALAEGDVAPALINAPAGDAARGERGFGALAGREGEFEASVAQALAYANALKCPRVHVLAGIPGRDVDPRAALDVFAANLRRAAPEARRAGVTLLVEPINTRDIPGYALSRTEQARRLIEAAGAAEIGLQLDLYHRQIMQGDLIETVRAYADITRHIQIAGPPNRNEPDTGEVDFAPVFAAIDECGFDGWVGCEYHPRAGTEEGLAWMARYRA